MTGHPETWHPMVGARVPQATRDTILGLRSALGGVEGATMAAVLRELLSIALAAINPATVRRVGALAVAWGCTREEAWARVVEQGLAAVEQQEVP